MCFAFCLGVQISSVKITLAGVLIKLNILCLHKPCKAVCMTLCRRGCKFANLHSALMTMPGQS